MLMFLAFLDYY